MGDFYLLGLLVVGVIATWLFCALSRINPRDDEQEGAAMKEEPAIKRW